MHSKEDFQRRLHLKKLPDEEHQQRATGPDKGAMRVLFTIIL